MAAQQPAPHPDSLKRLTTTNYIPLTIKLTHILFLLLIPSLLTATPDTRAAANLFESGNAAYAGERFDDAVAAYEAILNRGLQSAPLYFNLAGAYARQDQFGKAILYYRRALNLDPGNRKYRRHLEVLQERALTRPETPAFFDSVVGHLSINTWTLLATAGFWLGVALFIIPPYIGNRRFYGTATLCLILTLLSGFAVHNHFQRRQKGIVVAESEAPLKVAPTSSSPRAGTLPEGRELRFTHHDRNHYYVVSDSQRGGWVDQAHFLPIIP